MYIITLPFDLYDILKLENDIKSKSSSLNTKLDGLIYDNANKELKVISISEFDEADIDNINECITNYTNTQISPRTKIINVGLQYTKISNIDYTTIFIYEYKPDIEYMLNKLIVKACCTYSDITNVEYSIRLVNTSLNIILGEDTFTNTNTNECDIDIINLNNDYNNLITYTLEIQVKVSNKKATLTINNATLLLQYI